MGYMRTVLLHFLTLMSFMSFYKQNIANTYNFLHYTLKPPDNDPTKTISVVHADYDEVSNASIVKQKKI